MLDEAQAGIKIAGRNINNLRYADDTTLMAESEEELRASWWKWKRRMKKLAWNSAFKKLKIVASGPITSWQIDHGKWDFIFWGAPKSLQMVTAAMKFKDACSLEKSYDQHRQHVKKQRHYFANSV